MLRIIPAVLISYLLGSLPTAYAFGRLKGIDIRKTGSGNVGATNAARALGRGVGIAVLAIDILKGFIAVTVLSDLLIPGMAALSPINSRLLLGLSCIIGHNWTVFLGFKGGKGMATTLGVLSGLAVKIPGLSLVFLLVILSWLAAFLVFRIVSLASVLSAISLPIYILLFKAAMPGTLVFFGLLLCLLIILRHKPNLIRLFNGREPRFTLRKSA